MSQIEHNLTFHMLWVSWVGISSTQMRPTRVLLKECLDISRALFIIVYIILNYQKL